MKEKILFRAKHLFIQALVYLLTYVLGFLIGQYVLRVRVVMNFYHFYHIYVIVILFTLFGKPKYGYAVLIGNITGMIVGPLWDFIENFYEQTYILPYLEDETEIARISSHSRGWFVWLCSIVLAVLVTYVYSLYKNRQKKNQVVIFESGDIFEVHDL